MCFQDEKAGFVVLKIISEPISATLQTVVVANTIDVRNITEKTSINVLTFDLGGGTFDTTICNILVDEFMGRWTTTFAPLIVDGNHTLGGQDVNHLLAKLIKKKISSKLRHDWDEVTDLELYDCIEDNIKKSFTEKVRKVKTKLTLTNDSNNLVYNGDITILKKDYMSALEPFIEKIKKPLKSLKKHLEETDRKLDVAIAVGGSSNLHFVNGIIKDVFGEDLEIIHPETKNTAVAEGATVQCHIEIHKNKSFHTVDLVPLDLGIGVHNGKVIKLIEKGIIALIFFFDFFFQFLCLYCLYNKNRSTSSCCR